MNELYIYTDNKELLKKYESCLSGPTTNDSGFDLYMPADITVEAGQTVLVDLGVRCEPAFKGGYYMFPRSSMGKTPLRLANSVGIIDNGYRGTLKAMVHNTGREPFTMKEGERYFQLCHPSLIAMHVSIVDKIDMNTVRGEGGFGSTNK